MNIRSVDFLSNRAQSSSEIIPKSWHVPTKIPTNIVSKYIYIGIFIITQGLQFSDIR